MLKFDIIHSNPYPNPTPHSIRGRTESRPQRLMVEGGAEQGETVGELVDTRAERRQLCTLRGIFKKQERPDTGCNLLPCGTFSVK